MGYRGGGGLSKVSPLKRGRGGFEIEIILGGKRKPLSRLAELPKKKLGIDVLN
jgi:hypothetical protein